MTSRLHRQAIVSIADQAVFSGAMLVLNILLARWTSPEEYGAFAVLFAIFLILAGLHNAVIVEPMSVFGPQRSSAARKTYLRHVYLMHGIVSVALVAAASLVVVFLDNGAIRTASWALPVTLPLAMTFWLTRRKCYVESRPDRALFLSTLYALAVVAGLSWLFMSESLSAFSAFIVFGLAGFAVSLPDMARTCRGKRRAAQKTYIDDVRQHVKYGRWSLGESIAFALGASILPLAIAWFMSVGEAGKFRAMQVVFLPLTHLITGLGLLLLPVMSKLRAAASTDRFVARARTVLLVFVMLAVAYVLPILLLGRALLMLIYANPDYLDFLPLLPYLALNGVAAAWIAALMIIARSAERPDIVFVATAWGSGAMLTAGIAAIAAFGLPGIAAALLLNTGVTAIVLAWYGRHLVHQSPPDVSRHAREGANV